MREPDGTQLPLVQGFGEQLERAIADRAGPRRRSRWRALALACAAGLLAVSVLTSPGRAATDASSGSGSDWPSLAILPPSTRHAGAAVLPPNRPARSWSRPGTRPTAPATSSFSRASRTSEHGSARWRAEPLPEHRVAGRPRGADQPAVRLRSGIPAGRRRRLRGHVAGDDVRSDLHEPRPDRRPHPLRCERRPYPSTRTERAPAAVRRSTSPGWPASCANAPVPTAPSASSSGFCPKPGWVTARASIRGAAPRGAPLRP